jgi:co-chaperonin GroES (HSP10)
VNPKNTPEADVMKNITVILPNRVTITCPTGDKVLMLAASNIKFGKSKDDQGKEQHGWTAALSMMIGDDRNSLKAFKVHSGKSVRFDKFAVNVQRIESSRFGMVVLAEISAGE